MGSADAFVMMAAEGALHDREGQAMPSIVSHLRISRLFRLKITAKPQATVSLHIKILRLRMMRDDAIGALFRREHEVFRELQTDLFRLEQLK